MSLQEEINKNILLFDGATGTVLQNRGLAPGELPEVWNILHPAEITGLHAEYLKAGSNIIKTNTFGANAFKAAAAGYNLDEVVKAGVLCARNAVERHGYGYVALDIGPTGKLLKPMGDLDFEDAVDAFAQTIRAGACGADLVLIETFSDVYEAKAAVIAAKENCQLPIFVTFTFGTDGRLMTGADARCAAAVMEGLGVAAVGINCGFGPDKFQEVLKQFLKATNLPLIVNPNAGMPKSVDGKTVYDIDALTFAKLTAQLVREGAAIAGGCCGTLPEYISALLEEIKGITPAIRHNESITRVASGSRCVEFSDTPVLIGERINPTGKPKFKEALRSGDMGYVLNEAARQEEDGAHLLDVNVGLPGIDEPQVLYDTVVALQRITPLPLQIDTSNADAMEKALRVYNGKPLVNSVNGRLDNMKTVLPMVKKYGGAVVALTLDENGIPDTAEGRLAIAKKIIAAAGEYGIGKENIIIDPLALAVSADSNAARVTLESVELIGHELGVKTVLGVSNVSFGLPQREIVSTAFLTLALSRGLSAAIINPNSVGIMNAVRAFNALSGYDENFDTYISSVTGNEQTAAVEQRTLSEAIARGLEQQAREIAAELVKTAEPLEVVNKEIIPALDKVGADFEGNRIFLPQLLKSAAAATAAFDSVKKAVKAGTQHNRGTIVLATVEGDIHDIGKNIVKVILENYSFKVVDLGRDVPPQAVVDAVIENNAGMAGLSALMTTTLPAMGKTVKLLREKVPHCRIVVGGAVLNAEYAEEMGADCYARDAMESVRYAEKVFG